jgi:CMP-N-acetylneuraminic acid synthetase
MPTISVLVNARTQSTRLPRKLVRPFAGTTLIDIALDKMNRMDFFAHRYFAAAESELKDRVPAYPNIELLERDAAAVAPGYNDHRKVYAHYAKIQSDYIVWLNPCHPLLSLGTLRRAVDEVMATRHNSYTSVIPSTDWIFDDQGTPITNTQASMLSTAHSRKFYKVAHGFHVINKAFFLKDYQYWTLTRNDPALIEIPEEESYDVNTEIEFIVAEVAYLQNRKPGSSQSIR